MLSAIINGENIEETIKEAIVEIHKNGPINPSTFEKLSYIKRFHPLIIQKYESRLITVMGLFYKHGEPNSIVETVYRIFMDSIRSETGIAFTPTQADAYKNISLNKYFSFSAPTSSGKSFLFREIIKQTDGDIVIVLPSRALISEYIIEINKLTDNKTLVLQFIENVNIDIAEKRIFIITPERGNELFKYKDVFNVQLMLFDEAQLSEEDVRGLKFDAFVRRADFEFPNAKKVFAHPFVDNPEAQLAKHNFETNSLARRYNQYSVGKIFISYFKRKFEYFTPYDDSVDRIPLEQDIATEVLNANGTLLIYIAKSKIYDGRYLKEFGQYINLCPRIETPEALDIIENLRKYIGASKTGIERHSLFLEMMNIGVVIHHGSMPLKARLLIEKYIKSGFAKICFATSTLNQGINMPFDLVWIDNFRSMDSLTLKNLIGRSGRSSLDVNRFDYGFTVIKSENIQTFVNRLNESVEIDEHSVLDDGIDSVTEDMKDIVEAITSNSFDDNYNLPSCQIERLRSDDVYTHISNILNLLFIDNRVITATEYYQIDDDRRKSLKNSFKYVYKKHLRRSDLTASEMRVLSTAIPILLWRVQGKSFSEIVSLRYSYLSKRNERRSINKRLKSNEITRSEYEVLIDELKIAYSAIAAPLPNSTFRAKGLFNENESVVNIKFDLIVYDTYDYLDKVISLSLSDPICAALQMYYDKLHDERAIELMNYVRYGTKNEIEIWLMRYGFDAEDINWIKELVVSIDENRIQFVDEIHNLDQIKFNVIKRYVNTTMG